MPTKVCFAGILLLATSAWAAAVLEGVAADVSEGDEIIKDRAGFLPIRKYQALGGSAVGILVSKTKEVVGLEGRSGPTDAVCFSSAGGSYRWVYVPVKAKPAIGELNVPVGEDGKVTKRFHSLSLANPETVKQWQITEPFALVEVEVNGGLGCPAGESFVATKMRRLDGSKEYPLRVAEVIDRLRKRYQADVQKQQKAIDAAMSKIQKEALKDRKPTGPHEMSELMYVTWIPKKEQLRVHFRTRVTDGAYGYGRGIDPRRDGGPAALPPPPPTKRTGMRYGTQFGVEFGKAYEVSKAGDVVRTQSLPIESFKNRILPPPTAPRRPVERK